MLGGQSWFNDVSEILSGKSSDDDNYGDDEDCTFVARQTMRVTASFFDTESGYDFLRVGGRAYHGSSGPTEVLMRPGDRMTWSSDGSVTRGGFTICATLAE